MRRIFIKALLEEQLTIEGSDAHHIGHVMRGRVGEHIIVADDAGKVGEYEITAFTADTVVMQLLHYVEECHESPIEITLAQCLPKGDKMDLIVQKATELGVNCIVPLSSDNCVVKYDGKKAAARQAKWQKIADEAGKQCSRDRLPVVQPVTALKQWLQVMATEQADTAVCMCYENEEQLGIRQFLLTAKDCKKFIIVIGPEGGFSLDEAALARELGIASVSLGSRILRAETAAVTAVALVQYENGDLGGR